MGRKRGDIRHLVAIGTFVTLVLFGGIQAAQAATFGKTAVGGTNDNSYALRLGATKFTSPADAGTLTNLSVYTTNATGPDVCVAIYDDAAGYPGTKIAQACGGSGSGWRTYAVAAALSPNTVYWLTFLDDDGGYTYRYDAGAANQFVKSNSGSYPTLPATFPGGGTFYSREFSIYATYTPIDICPGNVVTTTADSGVGSLRECINKANVNPGTAISFNIPGAGPHTIQPGSPLPALAAQMTIDGYTQPGAQPNTVPAPGLTDAVLQIQLDGSVAGAGVDTGLWYAVSS
jgi:hypothetical protein